MLITYYTLDLAVEEIILLGLIAAVVFACLDRLETSDSFINILLRNYHSGYDTSGTVTKANENIYMPLNSQVNINVNGESSNLISEDSRRIKKVIIDKDLLNMNAVIENNNKLLTEFDNMINIDIDIDIDNSQTFDPLDYNYKLLSGDYAWGVLYAGYNQHIMEHDNNNLLAPYPDYIDNSQLYSTPHLGGRRQLGGNADEIIREIKADNDSVLSKLKNEFSHNDTGMTGVSGTSNYNYNYNCKNTLNIEGYSYTQTKESRNPNVLYSGDLIMITNNNTILQRGTIDSQIVFNSPVKNVGTNLSKIRFVSINHKPNVNTALHYGDTINIKHNIYFNNRNESRFIKYGDKLQSHQEGKLFNEYVIYDPNNLNSKAEIKINKMVIISTNDTTTNNKFLMIMKDGTVTCKSPVNTATEFLINLYRVSEVTGTHLSVKQDEILFP